MSTLKQRIAIFALKAAESALGRGSFGFSSEINSPINSISLAGIRMSTDSLFTIWRNHSDVFACVRELCDNTLSAGFEWENATDNKKDPDAKSVQLAEAILTKNYTFRQLKNEAIKNRAITGNAYFLKQVNTSGQVIGLQSIDPRTLSVVTDKYGTIIKWIQRVATETQTFQPDEILQWRDIQDPNNPVFGLSPLEPIIWEVRTDLSAMVSNYVFFQNDAQPAAQYILEEGLDEESIKKAVDMLQNQLRGSENRHKSVVLTGVKEVKKLAISQKDMEFSVLRKFTTEKVCAALGVPKAILNYTEDVNRSNGEEQTKKFWEGTIIPWQESFAEFVNKIFLPAIGVQNIKFCAKARKFDDAAATSEDMRADLEHGIITINEAREAKGYAAYDPSVVGEWVNEPLIFNGANVRPVEDIGIDTPAMGSDTSNDPAAVEDQIKKIRRFAKKFEYANRRN